jgi:hypothetical protein
VLDQLEVLFAGGRNWINSDCVSEPGHPRHTGVTRGKRFLVLVGQKCATCRGDGACPN